MSAVVRREHREMACQALHGHVPEDGSWLRGWCLTGRNGHAASWQWRQLKAVAQAIADAEARGYARCQADVVAEARRRSGLAAERLAAMEDDCTRHSVDDACAEAAQHAAQHTLEDLAAAIERGEHEVKCAEVSSQSRRED